jgi:hypothetical protein
MTAEAPRPPPAWFPFDRAEARRAFVRVLPPDHIDALLSDIYEGGSAGGAVTEPMLILLALESEAAAAGALALRPDLKPWVERARRDPANVNAILAEFAMD